MSGKHWAVLATFLLGFSAQLATLDSWASASKPVFVSAVIAQFAAFLLALFGEKPNSGEGADPQ